jgi:DNA-binding winged helix-turn-helix (wHTH) protein/Tol biopolymer transport system component
MAERYSFGAFTVDVSTRRLSRDGDLLPLPSRAFDTLVHLLRHRDRIVEKDELIKTVWQGAFVSDDSLVHCISVLRRAVQDEAERPELIVTLPRRGYQFVGDVTENPTLSEAGDENVTTPPSAQPAPRPARRPAVWVTLTACACALAVVAVLGAQRVFDQPAVPSSVVLAQPPPPGTVIGSGGMLSPDGRFIAFVAREQSTGLSRIWVRNLESLKVQPLDGTEGASRPFWSADSRSLGYFASDKLKTTPLAGGPSRTLTHLSGSPAGAAWSRFGVIIFGDVGRGLMAIDANGGVPTPVTAVDVANDVAHAWPSFLPDGRRYLYTITSWNPDRAGIWIGSLDPGGEPRRLIGADSPALFAEPGQLLFVLNDALVGMRVNPNDLMPLASPKELAAPVVSPRVADGETFSVSGTLLSYRSGSRTDQLAWFTRDGAKIGALHESTPLRNPTLSPDGQHLLATGIPSRDPGLWLVDLKGTASTRLRADGIGPIWAPDGRRIAFTSQGGLDINLSSTVGQVDEQLLLHDDTRKVLQAWSPDGQYVVYTKRDPGTQLDLWLVPVAQPDRARPLLATTASERGAVISPNGRWIAYSSDESGQSEIYIQEFPGLGSKRVVSLGGGGMAFWRQDGRELFYLAPDRMLMAVDLRFDPLPQVDRPRPLFRAPLLADASEARNHYIASADGRMFLINVAEDGSDRASIAVMVNWLSRLTQNGDPSPASAPIGLLAQSRR